MRYQVSRICSRGGIPFQISPPEWVHPRVRRLALATELLAALGLTSVSRDMPPESAAFFRSLWAGGGASPYLPTDVAALAAGRPVADAVGAGAWFAVRCPPGAWTRRTVGRAMLLLAQALGPGYAFAPDRRREGGLEMVQWPGRGRADEYRSLRRTCDGPYGCDLWPWITDDDTAGRWAADTGDGDPVLMPQSGADALGYAVMEFHTRQTGSSWTRWEVATAVRVLHGMGFAFHDWSLAR